MAYSLHTGRDLDERSQVFWQVCGFFRKTLFPVSGDERRLRFYMQSP